MENRRITSTSPIPTTQSQKFKFNSLVSKILDFHYKKPSTLKSSRMIPDSNIDEEIENIQKFILINHKKKLRNSPDLTGQNRNSSRIASSYKGIRMLKLKRRKKLSLENLQTLAETDKDYNKKEKDIILKESSNPLLNKHKAFFDLLDKKSKPMSLISSNSQSTSNIKSSKLLKLEVEKNLHEEYIKDRVKFKLGNGQYICNKKIWRPDCLKILRKADKALSSIPKTRA